MDDHVKHVIRQVRNNSADMIDYLQNAINGRDSAPAVKKNVMLTLEEQLEKAQDELKATITHKVRDCMRHPDKVDEYEAVYEQREAELQRHISGLKNQIQMVADRSAAIEQVRKKAQTVLEVFDSILAAETISHEELIMVVNQITVHKDYIDIRLRSDVDELMCCGTLDEIPKDAVVLPEFY